MRDRTEFLVRKNSGQRALAPVLAELGARLSRAVRAEDVHPLERGDALRAIVNPRALQSREAAAPPAFSVWTESSTPALAYALGVLGAQMAPAEVFYLPSPSTGIGPILIDTPRDLAHAVALARIPSEECLICTADGWSGLWLQYHAADAEHGSLHPYELLIWGADWRALAQQVVPFELAADEA